MAELKDIDLTRVPQHVAVIMDGNGRWAKGRGMERSEGHKAGVQALRTTMEAAMHAGVKYLTVYTFSTENWNRPQQEVDTLMNLIAWSVEQQIEALLRYGVRLRVLGDMSRLPDFAADKLRDCVERTSQCQAITLVLALNYSSRWELTDTMQRLAQQCVEGSLRPEEITQDLVSRSLRTAEYPDPDLLIRTGGECRISNYLLWQISYSELYFCDTLWPDFGAPELYDAIVSFQQRERRFGKTSAQVQSEHLLNK